MRIVFIGKSHRFSLVPLAALRAHHEVVGFVESAGRGARPRPVSALRRLVRTLRRRRGALTLESIARSAGADYLLLTRDNPHELCELLERTRPDLLCVASMSQLLRAEALAVPAHGAINLHPSLLPKYHGPFPWLWQYLGDEREIGVSVHRIDSGQDTGPIVKQEPFALERGLDVQEAIERAAAIGARLMVEAAGEIVAGTAVFRPQPPHDWPKARIVRRDERLIDWDGWPIERTWHALRGTYPWLDAVPYPFAGRWRIGAYELAPSTEPAGTVHRDGAGYYVAHREGRIRLTVDRDPSQSR